jgi:hypothetical protein
MRTGNYSIFLIGVRLIPRNAKERAAEKYFLSMARPDLKLDRIYVHI